MLNASSTGCLLSALWIVFVAGPLAAQSGQVVRIIQTNSAGTNAHLIDPDTHEVLAVIEGAILVSRLHMLPEQRVAREIAHLEIAVSKTAGPDEREAWGWIMERIAAHRCGASMADAE